MAAKFIRLHVLSKEEDEKESLVQPDFYRVEEEVLINTNIIKGVKKSSITFYENIRMEEKREHPYLENVNSGNFTEILLDAEPAIITVAESFDYICKKLEN